jgi:hypothetical protein
MLFLQDCQAFNKKQKLALMNLIDILGGAGYSRPTPKYEGAKNQRFDEVDKEVKRQSEGQGIKYNEKIGYVITPKTKKATIRTVNMKFVPNTVKISKREQRKFKTKQEGPA